MSKLNHAFFPGSFDPFTNGHLDVLKKAINLFDRVTIGIFQNSDKNSGLLTYHDRSIVINEIVHNMKVDNIGVLQCSNEATVDVCHKVEANIIVRGMRSISDYEYELKNIMANRSLAPDIETVLVVPNIENQYVSSSLVREFYKYKKFDQIKYIVPTEVYEYIMSEEFTKEKPWTEKFIEVLLNA